MILEIQARKWQFIVKAYKIKTRDIGAYSYVKKFRIQVNNQLSVIKIMTNTWKENCDYSEHFVYRSKITAIKIARVNRAFVNWTRVFQLIVVFVPFVLNKVFSLSLLPFCSTFFFCDRVIPRANPPTTARFAATWKAPTTTRGRRRKEKKNKLHDLHGEKLKNGSFDTY